MFGWQCTWNKEGGKKRELGGEWIHLYVCLSPFTLYLNLSQHCLLIGYTPIQNKKLKKIRHCLNKRVRSALNQLYGFAWSLNMHLVFFHVDKWTVSSKEKKNHSFFSLNESVVLYFVIPKKGEPNRHKICFHSVF